MYLFIRWKFLVFMYFSCTFSHLLSLIERVIQVLWKFQVIPIYFKLLFSFFPKVCGRTSHSRDLPTRCFRIWEKQRSKRSQFGPRCNKRREKGIQDQFQARWVCLQSKSQLTVWSHFSGLKTDFWSETGGAKATEALTWISDIVHGSGS